MTFKERAIIEGRKKIPGSSGIWEGWVLKQNRWWKLGNKRDHEQGGNGSENMGKQDKVPAV